MRHARALGSRWDELNARQLGAIRGAVVAGGGRTVRTEGDALFARLHGRGGRRPGGDRQPAAAHGDVWPRRCGGRGSGSGLHTGEAHLAGDDYGGFDVNRAARIAAVGHGGQIVLSDPFGRSSRDRPAGRDRIRDLGRHALRDVPEPEQLFQLDAPGLQADFPPLRTARRAPATCPHG